MEVLEATIVGVDMVLSEVVKQVQLACLERAELIDRCRKHFLAMFAHMATALFTSQAQLRGVHERGEGLEVTIGPLREEHKLAVQKIAALELELKSANERMVAMEAVLKPAPPSHSPPCLHAAVCSRVLPQGLPSHG